MKVGKGVAVSASPFGTIIWSTNMVPVRVERDGKSEEQFKAAVEEAVAIYRREREEMAAKYGELE